MPGVFGSGDDALSPVDVITGCDDVLVALQYRFITGYMFGKIAKKSTGAVYNQTFCVSHDDLGENKSVCRVWQPTDRQGRPIVTCVCVNFDA